MDKPFADKRIGVLMGGWSGEREVSLRSGKGVLESLLKSGYNAVGIDVGHDADARLREEKVEVAFIVLHGIGGEDGVIQGLLEAMRIPYTGSGITASALAMDKELSKLVLKHHGLAYPETVYLSEEDGVEAGCETVLKQIGLPAVIKPMAEGSSIGISIMHDEKEMRAAVADILGKYHKCLVEKYVKGTEVTVGVVGKGTKVRALPILELIPKNEFYDFEAKYTKGMTDMVCPARLDEELTKKTQALAVKAHLALGCHGVSRVDFLIGPDRKPLVLEVNTLPGMTPTSDLPEEIVAEGGTYDSLVLEILSSATIDR